MAVTFMRTYYARGGQVLWPLKLDSNCSSYDSGSYSNWRSEIVTKLTEFSNIYSIDARFLERKIWSPLAYVADRLKKLRGSGQPYLVNVKIVLM